MSNATWYTLVVAFLISWGSVIPAANAQTASKSDHRINDEDYATDGTSDNTPTIASSTRGFTVVWGSRGNTSATDILARLFDAAGRPLGKAFRVNDASGTFIQPRVARYSPQGSADDTAGTSVAVFQSGGSNSTTYAQVFGNNGRPIGRSFIVDSSGIGKQSSAAVAMHPTGAGSPGSFMVTWTDQLHGLDTIRARIFKGNGEAAGPVFRVNENTTRNVWRGPVIAAGGAPNIAVIVWQELNSEELGRGVSHTMARVFTLDGTPLGPTFHVDTSAAFAPPPGIAVAADGSFVVAYTILTTGNHRRIYAQRFNPSGTRIGAPISIGAASITAHQQVSGVAIHADSGTGSYGFTVTWEELEPQQNQGTIYARSFNGAGDPQGAPILINRPPLSSLGSAAIATVGHGDAAPQQTRALIVWSDNRSLTLDVYGQLLESGALAGDNFRVNSVGTGGAAQRQAAIDATPTGMQVAVWQDERSLNQGPRIYGKWLSNDGNALGPDFRITELTGFGIEQEPDVVVFPDSSFVVAWAISKSRSTGIVGIQRFNARGERMGSEIQLSDSLLVFGTTATIDGTPDGRFVVVWRNNNNTVSGMIGGRRYHADGTPDGPVFRVDDEETKEGVSIPNLAVAPDGSFAVTWSDSRSGKYNVRMQRFDTTGNRVSTNVRVNEQVGDIHVWPAIDIAPNGTAMVAWLEYRSGFARGDVTAQRFGPDGARIGGNIRVNDRDSVLHLLCLECGDEPPAVAAMKPTPNTQNDASFVITWADARDSTQNIYAQWYGDDGSPERDNIRISNGPAGTTRLMPDVARDSRTNNVAYFAWSDDRDPNDDMSIWGAILDTTLQTTGVNVTTNESSMADVRAFPNPVAGSVTFSFRLPEAAHARLVLYSLQGEAVATVANDAFDAGVTEMEWAPGSLPAGVYLYRLEAGALYASGRIVIAR